MGMNKKSANEDGGQNAGCNREVRDDLSNAIAGAAVAAIVQRGSRAIVTPLHV